MFYLFVIKIESFHIVGNVLIASTMLVDYKHDCLQLMRHPIVQAGGDIS